MTDDSKDASQPVEIDYFAMPQHGNKGKKKDKSKRVRFSVGWDKDGTYASKLEIWIKQCVELYMWASEPLYPEEAEALRDHLDRPIPQRFVGDNFGMRIGHAYMTKDLLRAAWAITFGTDYSERAPVRSTDAKYGRHIDHWLRAYKNDRIIDVAEKNCYFFPEQTIRRNNLTEYAAEFQWRKSQWEERQSSSLNKEIWDRLIRTLHDVPLFDFKWLDSTATLYGIDTHNGTLTATKLKRLQQDGFCYPLSRGIWRVSKWDEKQDPPDDSLSLLFNNWLLEYIRCAAYGQYLNPLATFTAEDVRNHFRTDRYIEEGYKQDRKKLEDLDYINRRLRENALDTVATTDPWYDLVTGKVREDVHRLKVLVRIRHGHYQIDSRLVRDWFRFDLREDVGALAMNILEQFTRMNGQKEPWWFTIKDIQIVLGAKSGQAPEVLKYLEKRELIKERRSVFHPAAHKEFTGEQSRYHPEWFELISIYTANKSAFELFGVPYLVDPDHMEILTERDFFPLRRPSSWEKDKEYTDFLNRVQDSYEWAEDNSAIKIDERVYPEHLR